jgi:hypothetical protein
MTDPTPASFRIIGGDGEEYGPVDLATLQEWAGQRRVAASTKVWDSRTGNWQPADRIPELARVFGIASAPPAILMPVSLAGPRTNPLAVWSLSLSVVGLSCCGCLSIPAIILGFIALSQIKQRGDGGRGIAIAGVAIGIFSLLLSVVLGLLWTTFRLHMEGLDP